MCKYKTLEELKKALDNKELPDSAELMIDNNAVYMYTGFGDDDTSVEEDNERKLFDFNGDPTFELLPEALRLLGFKASPV